MPRVCKELLTLSCYEVSPDNLPLLLLLLLLLLVLLVLRRPWELSLAPRRRGHSE